MELCDGQLSGFRAWGGADRMTARFGGGVTRPQLYPIAREEGRGWDSAPFCIPPLSYLDRMTVNCLAFLTWGRRGRELLFSTSTDEHTVPRWYAQSESIIIKTHCKTIVFQDFSFYLLVFFLSLLLFTVPRCKTIVLKHSRIFLLVLL
jgi:hypothetical protein